MTGKIVYVLSDTRSGSTLLDQLLGAHGEILSLGEVHHLVAYVRQDRALYNPAHPLVCSCGEPIASCIFWQRVEQQLGRPLGSLRLRNRVLGQSEDGEERKSFLRRIARRLLVNYPRLYRSPAAAGALDTSRVAADSFALFDAIFKQHGKAEYLVDSSKSPFRFRALFDARPERVIALVLARDYRGTVYSKIKRGRDLRKSAESWARRMTRIKSLTSDVPRQQLIRVRYEDICSDPRAELDRICNFLDVEFSEEMLSRPLDDVHHLGGSPSKFDPTKTKIELDSAYSRAFCEEDLALLQKIAGDAAAEWGYY